ncbi:hypothetical protein [Pseudonocardia sp. N23]|uniref:hypothetical protein n=1 Tax=Pseudonocardia sp. N23 TaxID=1987376 RepID=UPI000BFC28B6|nr:hypothetical protein [Pseudonocardia sp. N23]GAY09501.1 putative integral membrane protein [Pseudonocardia sp. N23]
MGEGHVELRVHGVAGTPPAVMLQLVPPVRVDRPEETGTDADGAISEWRRPPERPELRAWSWGSLTSGRWYQAFYVVLLPFMLANLAGWALLAGPDAPGSPDVPARRGPRVRLAVLLVRVGGLLVTVVFVLWAQLIVADLGAYQWLVRRLGAPVWVVGAGFLAATGVLLVVVFLSRIRQRPAQRRVDPWSVWTDPAGRVSLHHDQQPMWDSPGVNVALRRLHLGAALGVLGLVGCWPGAARGGVWELLGRVGFWVAVAGLGVVAVLLCLVSLADGAPRDPVGAGPVRGRGLPPAALVRHGTWPLPVLAVAAAVAASAGITPAWVVATPFLPAIRGSALWLTVALLVVAVAMAVVGGPGRRRDGRARHADLRRANAPAILLIAAATGAALGAGLAEQVARLVGGGLVVGEAVGWMAAAFTTILTATLVVVAFAWLALRFVAVGRRRTLPAPVALRALTIRASWLTALLAVLGAAVAGTGVVVALVRGDLPSLASIPPVVSTSVVVALVALVLAGVVAAGRHRRLGAAGWVGVALSVAGVAVLVVVALRAGWSVQVLGVPVPPRTFADLALSLAVLLPTLLLLRRMHAAVRSVSVRRGIGVLWDVGTFWPRWFHPLAPPTYSDRAVTGLAARIAAGAGPGPAGAGAPLVVAAHSQGSVVAGTALLLAPAPLGPVALFTFGSPWQHLYGEFFPAWFDAAATTALDRRLEGRWRNMWRDTDPVGGPVDDLIDEPGTQLGADPGVDPGVDLAPLADPYDRVHGGYWLEPQYDAAVARLVRAVRRDEAARVTREEESREQNARSGRCAPHGDS